MDALLQSSPNVGVQELFESIGRDPKFLDIDKDAVPVFVDTPLHKAVRRGNAELALQILQLMPSQGRKLNPEGYSPLHIALRGGNMDLVRRLIKLDPEIIRVPGREGITPLHYAVEQDEVKLVAEFLLYCPDAIDDLTIRGETALHVAQKNGNLKALRVLYGWVKWKHREEVLELQDWEGKTVSDPTFDTETETEVMEHGKFVDYLCSSSPREQLRRMLDTYKLDSETRNAIMVVAVLIATATFQAVLSPPGGFSDGNPISNSNISPVTNATIIANENKDGHSMMPRKDFTAFAAVNSIAFGSSLLAIMMALPFHLSNGLLYLCSIFFAVTYILAIKLTSPDPKIVIAIAVILPLYLLCVVYLRLIFVDINLLGDEKYWKIILDKTYHYPARGKNEKVEVEVQRS